MKYFRVSKENEKFVITETDYNISSPQFQYAKRNFNLFTSYDEAMDYILKNVTPEDKDDILRGLKEEKLLKMVEDYLKVKEKKDLEKLFDIILTDESYRNLVEFIDFIKN